LSDEQAARWVELTREKFIAFINGLKKEAFRDPGIAWQLILNLSFTWLNAG